MRRTKIVCTLGPASTSPDVIEELIRAGMNVARLNFSHGTHEDHYGVYHDIRRISKEVGRPVAILQDLQGPKIRVGRFAENETFLVEGEEFVISVDDFLGNGERVSTTYKDLHKDVSNGDLLLLDDGLLTLRVLGVHGPDVHCVVVVGGRLKNNKGINIPGAAVSAPSMTPKDLEDLEFGLGLGVDFVALSFVRSPLDIHQLRAKMSDDRNPKIIAKIEKPQAIDVLDDIIAVADGIMVARGDLGVELPPQKVPIIQKRAIRIANSMGKISITATQMLESMTENPRPTRAEASDVANAVLDGSDAVMLSGETASGKYPVQAVRMMADIIKEVELHSTLAPQLDGGFSEHLKTFPAAVARSAASAAHELDVKGIAVLTLSGSTARLLKTYRPNKPIFACTPDERLARQMALYWGVVPHHIQLDLSKNGAGDQTYTSENAIARIEDILRRNHEVVSGDEVIVVMGSPVRPNAETNLIKFHRIS